MSHRRAVCRGNLVFCCTQRNLSVHRLNTNHLDSLHTSDGALICFALISHRRDVCRGNLVFCCTHRNLSVHRLNTNHSDSLHTSDLFPTLLMIASWAVTTEHLHCLMG